MPEIPKSPRKRVSLHGRWDPGRDLHLCPHCGHDFVSVVERESMGEEHSWLLLRCGGCELMRELTVSNDFAARLDDELERRARILDRAVARLERERMTAWVEAVAEALRRELIDAGDFVAQG
jgi:hypothetical protein